jgi:phage repressor protein C with HTH and peptisase S24 domain
MNNGIRSGRKKKGWSQTELADAIAHEFPGKGGWQPTTSDISRLERQGDPDAIPLTHDRAQKLAKVLDLTLSEVLGEAPQRRTVPLVGYVGAGDLYYPDPVAGPWVGFDVVEAPWPDVVAVKVKGRSMEPVYRDGDLLFFSTGGNLAPSDCIGEDCIVQVRSGPAYIKAIERGTKPSRYKLVSYDGETPPIDNVDIEWAAPVRHVTRARRKQ